MSDNRNRPSEVDADRRTERRSVLKTIGVGVGSIGAASVGLSDVASAWKPKTHRQITYLAAANNTGMADAYVEDLRDWSDDPDYWDQNCDFDDDTLQKYCQKIIHSKEHYWNPDWNTGEGPKNAEIYIEDAKDYYEWGYYGAAVEYTAYALHHVQDLADPLHTGMEAEQVDHRWVHDDFEEHVRDNWEAYDWDETAASPGWSADVVEFGPRASAKDLGRYASDYRDDVYDKVYNSTYDEELHDVIDYTVELAAGYSLGFIEYVGWDVYV